MQTTDSGVSHKMEPEKLGCSICLDLLKDPVTIPCGHSYCMNCIRSYWDEEDQKETHSCPQCRQMFRPRPELVRNTVMADLVEEVKKTRLESAPSDLCYAGPGDVSCDFCTGRKLKAVKSCLQCLVSYCDQHLQPHYDVAAFKKHKLVDPSRKLEENICSRHDKLMEVFCRTDQQCICYLCSLDEHRGHDTVSAAAERNDKQRELAEKREKIQQRIREKEEGVKVLQQEITELKRRSSELELLSQTDDHIQFLQNYILLERLSEATESTVSDGADKPQDVLSGESTENSQINYLSTVFRKQKLVNTSTRLHEHPDRFTIAVVGKNPEFNKTIQDLILSYDNTSDKTLNDFVVPENNSFRIISCHDFFDEECPCPDQQMNDFMAHSYDGLHLFILAIDSENAEINEAASQIMKFHEILGETVKEHLAVVFENYKSYRSLSQLKEMFNIELRTLSETLADDCKEWCSRRQLFLHSYRNYSKDIMKRRRNNLKRTRREGRPNYERPGRSSDSTHNAPGRTAEVQHRDESKSSMPFNIVLLGLTGTGKSASGNTILTAMNSQLDRSQLFESKPSSTPVTYKCEVREIKIFGRLVRVVDTPDFFDDDLNSQIHVDECKKYCQSGHCVVLLVIQMGRFTENENGILERLEDKLGWMIRENTIILLTHGENAKGQEQRFITERTYLDFMVGACGKRYHVFKNTSKNHEQVTELFKKFPYYKEVFPEFTEKPSWLSLFSWSR